MSGKRFFVMTAALAALTLPAMAADLPVYKAAPAPMTMGCVWCGFYIGGTAGGGWSDNNSVNVTTINTFNAGPTVSSPLGMTAGPASAAATTASIGTGHGTGFVGGFEAGYNWQFSNWVAGFETDIEGLTGNNSAAVTQVVPRTGFPGDTYTGTVAVSEKVGYLGTVRGRLGFLIAPTWLLYGTGGFAYGGVSSNTAITGAETPNTGTSNIAGFASTSGTQTGWAAGAGLEWLLDPRWTVKVEWLHYDLGSATYGNGALNGIVSPGTAVRFTDVSTSNVKFSGDFVRAGLNYKF